MGWPDTYRRLGRFAGFLDLRDLGLGRFIPAEGITGAGVPAGGLTILRDVALRKSSDICMYSV